MKLFYRDFGGEGKEPLVILHGLFGSSRNWRTVGKQLAKHFHTFAFDLPSHGRSPQRSLLTYEIMAQDVSDTITALHLSKVHLAGHSVGGKTAMLLACRHSPQVSCLTIVDIGPKEFPMPEQELRAMETLPIHQMTKREEALRQMEATITDLETRKFLLTNLSRDQQNRFYWAIDLGVLWESLEYLRQTPLLPTDNFTGPTQFVLSQKTGYVVPEDYPTIKQHFPNAEMTVIPNAGHNIHLDAPEKLLQLIVSS